MHPRLIISGLSGESGKTLISLGLCLAARRDALEVQAFKKGPDYIDAAWLGWASGRHARNLDSFMMGFDGVASSFARHALSGGLNVIEGNRGLFDGADSLGTHSTAELAKTLNAPVILVLSATKVTRTAAALVLGCQKLDPELDLAGVILNRVAGARHARVLREAVESVCGIPVVGVVPRASEETMLPERHLGLVPPEEHTGISDLEHSLAQFLEGRLDTGKIYAIARRARPLAAVSSGNAQSAVDGRDLTIGYFKDSAFTFYYPDNLEALEATGARVAPISALTATRLPADLHALYLGGGFPETHAAALAANRGLLESLRVAAANGMPVYAECGGLMLLANAIWWKGRRFPMAGVLPFDVEVCPTPQGHGYSRLRVDVANPFFPEGSILVGHEFHYSRILPGLPLPPAACAVERGTGCYEARDGIVAGRVWASYTHLHALATPEWAAGLVRAARQFAGELHLVA